MWSIISWKLTAIHFEQEIIMCNHCFVTFIPFWELLLRRHGSYDLFMAEVINLICSDENFGSPWLEHFEQLEGNLRDYNDYVEESIILCRFLKLFHVSRCSRKLHFQTQLSLAQTSLTYQPNLVLEVFAIPILKNSLLKTSNSNIHEYPWKMFECPQH